MGRENLHICHACISGCNGRCPCPHDLRDIKQHVDADYCPFPDGPKFGDSVAPANWADVPIIDHAIPPAPTPPVPIQPIPREKWPWTIRAVADYAEPPDGGVGDTVKRLLDEGGESFKRIADAAGVDCGCSGRQAEMNQRYPYASGQ